MTDAIVKRLEAVAAKLEAFASGSSSGSSSSSASSSGSSAGPSAKVQAYDQLYSSAIQPFIDAANANPGTKVVATNAETGLKTVRALLAAADQSKKPSDAALSQFLQPVSKAVEAGSNPDNRSPVFNQLKAWSEGQAGLLAWVQINPATAGTTPKQFIQDMLESADFYLNKVLVDAKKAGTEDGKFASTFKTAMQQLGNFVKEHYPTGIEWNPRGGELSAASSSSAPAAPSAPPAAPGAPAPPPGPPSAPGAPSSSAPSKPTTSGMGAVFGELTGKGDGVTNGLRKVTNDMKTKNMANVPVLEAKAPAARKASVSVPVAEVKKEARVYLSKGTWFVEHQDGVQDLILREVQLKENVYILKCKNCTITLPDKCKSVQVDNCTKTNIVFKSIVSVFEIFNSQRINIECQEYVPSVAVDKSAGVSVTLSRAAVANPPTLITSSITEMNLVVPGATDEDDPVEIPLPEQYETKLVPGQNKVATEAVSHSGN